MRLLLPFFVLVSACAVEAPPPEEPKKPTSSVVHDHHFEGVEEEPVSEEEVVEAPTGATGPSSPTETWKELAKLPSARDHHVSFSLKVNGKPRLFVAGGLNVATGKQIAEVKSLAYGDDAAVWENEVPLPKAHAAMALGVLNDTVIVAGGFEAGATANSDSGARVLVAERGANGGLTGWTDGPPLPKEIAHAQGVVCGGRFYVVGGFIMSEDGQVVFDSVFSTTFVDGALAPWREERVLPFPLTHHVAICARGSLYVTGGFGVDDGAFANTNVHRAALASDGSLGEWTQVGALGEARVAASVVLVDDAFVVVGGGDASQKPRKTLLHVPLANDGTVGAASVLPTQLPEARIHLHQVIVDDERIVFSGGREAKNSSAKTFSASYTLMRP